MKFWFFFLLPLLLLPTWGSVNEVPAFQGEEPHFRPGKDFALFFAVEEYENPDWKDLKNPINDAESIAKELREIYSFQTEIHRNPTKGEIESTLRQWREKIFPEGAQLFIFFSGHGDFDDYLNEGFFIPSDGRKEDHNTHLSLIRLGNIITEINCRHILLAIDACYSGTITQEIAFKGDPVMKRPYDTPATERKNLISRQLRNASRLLITSGGKERTLDGVNYSPFAESILNSLKYGYTEGDGLITFSDILSKLERVTPIPHQGQLPKHENGGFVFVAEHYSGISDPQRMAIDSQGNQYPILHLGRKQWLGKNLNFEIQDSYCYGNDPVNCNLFGRLYTWKASKKACQSLGPDWRLPTDLDWQELAIAFGGYNFFAIPEGLDMGNPEKAYTELTKDERPGFSAQLGGIFSPGEKYFNKGKWGVYWSSTVTEHLSDHSWSYLFDNDQGKLIRVQKPISNSVSCRCVRDD
ncbi:MAG: caspase family protein [Lewinellaceae bacterium]|nr:caspase family protein [Phaeodactylibacter sp.]MCB0616278.1 caspase family protein [Phaeodactylibacter sp.]MCB9352117.1 caspase family protein [Lewinellaceae bacterium]